MGYGPSPDFGLPDFFYTGPFARELIRRLGYTPVKIGDDKPRRANRAKDLPGFIPLEPYTSANTQKTKE